MRIFSPRLPVPIWLLRWAAYFSASSRCFCFEQAGAQDVEGLFLVLLLAAPVLAADDHAGGDVEDLDGGIGGVDALAAGAAGAADFDADFVGLEFEIDFLGLGQDGDGGGGGVDAALRLGGGDALDAVDAALVAHLAEDGLRRRL